jgi:hypothetical protein
MIATAADMFDHYNSSENTIQTIQILLQKCIQKVILYWKQNLSRYCQRFMST